MAERGLLQPPCACRPDDRNPCAREGPSDAQCIERAVGACRHRKPGVQLDDPVQRRITPNPRMSDCHDDSLTGDGQRVRA